jgi:hypothetical protein
MAQDAISQYVDMGYRAEEILEQVQRGWRIYNNPETLIDSM